MQKKEIMVKGNHYKDCTPEEISEYLSKVQKTITEGNYTISRREKNDDFFELYNISAERAKSILLSLTYKNFCWYQLDERNETDILFVFRVDKMLVCFDELKKCIIYIKTNYIEGNDFTVVISFHESDRPDELKYCFEGE